MLAPSAAFAGGFTLEHQNAAALGEAFAGAQAARGEIAFAAYNPASIGGIHSAEIDLSGTGVFPATSYDNANGALLGVAPVFGSPSGDTVIPAVAVPNITVAAPVGGGLNVGLIVNAPFGLKTDYSPFSNARYQAQHSELTTIEFTPIAAFELTKNISIGGGLRLQYADLNLTSIIDAGGIAAASMIPGFLPETSDLQASFSAKDWTLGYTAGAQIDFSPQFRAGAAWFSKIDHAFDGEASFNLAGSAAAQVLNGLSGLFAADGFSTAIATPGSVSFGFQYDASERLTLLASGKRTFWSSFDVVALSFNDGVTPPEVVTQNWHDSWQASVGAELKATEKMTLRTGVMWDQSPVDDALVHPRVPDGDRVWLAAGISQKFSDRISGDFGFAYAFFKDAHFALDGAAPENLFRGSFSGDYQTNVVAISGTLRVKF